MSDSSLINPQKTPSGFPFSRHKLLKQHEFKTTKNFVNTTTSIKVIEPNEQRLVFVPLSRLGRKFGYDIGWMDMIPVFYIWGYQEDVEVLRKSLAMKSVTGLACHRNGGAIVLTLGFQKEDDFEDLSYTVLDPNDKEIITFLRALKDFKALFVFLIQVNDNDHNCCLSSYARPSEDRNEFSLALEKSIEYNSSIDNKEFSAVLHSFLTKMAGDKLFGTSNQFR